MTKSEISKVVEAVVAALEQQKQPEAVVETADNVVVLKVTPKVDRAARKAQNKVLWRQVEGKIRKAKSAKTEVLAQGFLQEATAMTPAKWTSVHNKILGQHEVLCPSITV